MNTQGNVIDEKQFRLNYIMGLGIVAAVVTIALAVLKLFFSPPGENITAQLLLARQEALIQKIAYQATLLPYCPGKHEFRETVNALKAATMELQEYHQSILYGSTGLKLKKLTLEPVKNIYFHPASNLDKHISDFLVTAKLLTQLPAEKMTATHPHLLKIQQMAGGEIPALLREAQLAYRKNLERQTQWQDWAVLMIWGIILTTLAGCALFIFRPAEKNAFRFIERLRQSRLQLLAVTKKTEAEKGRLEKTLQQFRSAVESASAGILMVIPREKQLIFNRKFVEMLEIPGTITLSPTLETMQNALEDLVKNGAPLPRNFLELSHPPRQEATRQLQLSGGKIIECTAQPVDMAEAGTACVWSFYDLTRPQTQLRELAEQNRNLINIFNSIGDGVIVTDEQGQMTHVNPAAKALLGIETQENISREWFEKYRVLHPRSQTPLPPEDLPFTRALEGEFFDQVEMLIHPQGDSGGKLLDASGGPVKSTSGKVIGGVVVIRQKPKEKPSEEPDSTLDQFLDNVNEGIFFIEPDLQVSSKYSRALERILGPERLQSRNVLDLFRSLLPEHLLPVIEDYLKLIFHSVVTERYVEELNPLKEVEVELEDPENGWVTRYLEFNFHRIVKNDAVQSLMVTVRDVTTQITSVNTLKDSQNKIQKQIDLLFRVIHVDPALLEKFVEDCAVEIAGIHLTLKKDGFRENLQANLARISRSLLAIKENAGFLDLRIFEEKAARFEKQVLLLRSTPSFTDQDMQQLVEHLEDLHTNLDEVKHILDHLITRLKVKFRGKREEECRRFLKSIENYVHRVSMEAGKQVQLDTSQFNVLSIPFDDRKVTRDILVELFNALIHHSIEFPSQRKAEGKSPTGLIKLLTVNDTPDLFEFIVRDDGGGLKVLEGERPRTTTALQNGANSTDNSQNHPPALILNEKLFPKHKPIENKYLENDLKVVESKIQKIGGKINAFSQDGEYSEFYISLPKNEKNAIRNASNSIDTNLVD